MRPVYKRKSKAYSSFLLGFFFLVLILMVMIRTCSSTYPHSHKRPSGGDTIDVAIEYGPMSLYRYDDTLGGFAYDLLRHIEVAEGLTFKYHPVTTLSEALKGVDKGYYRLVVAAMPVNVTLRNKYATTVPVFLDRQVLVQKRSDDKSDSAFVASPLDLAGKKVWVMAGSPVADRLHNLAEEIGDTIDVVEVSDYGNEQLFILAALGDIPRAVVTERTAKALAHDYHSADISTAVSFTQFQSWLLNPADSLLRQRLDSIIQVQKETPFYDDLSARYQ